MSMNVLAIAGNFFLFIEGREISGSLRNVLDRAIFGMIIWNILDYSWNMRAGSGGFHL